MVQTLISDGSKKIMMSSNIVKRKREKEELEDHCEEDWDEELYSNSSNYVMIDEYRNGEVTTFGQLPYSKVYIFIMVSVQSVMWVTFLK